MTLAEFKKKYPTGTYAKAITLDKFPLFFYVLPEGEVLDKFKLTYAFDPEVDIVVVANSFLGAVELMIIPEFLVIYSYLTQVELITGDQFLAVSTLIRTSGQAQERC